jgi:hypothetical protein
MLRGEHLHRRLLRIRAMRGQRQLVRLVGWHMLQRRLRNLRRTGNALLCDRHLDVTDQLHGTRHPLSEQPVRPLWRQRW